MAQADVLERLMVLIEASTSGLRQELVKGASEVSTFQKRVDADVRRAETSFGRLGGTLRKTLGFFGIAFTAQAFAGWIKGALDAKDMTEAQLEATKEARAALASFGEASDSLARGLAGKLAPAIANVATSMEHLRRALLPTESEQFADEVVRIQEEINDLVSDIKEFESGGFWKSLWTDDSIEYARARVEKLREELLRLYEQGRQFRADPANPLAGLKTLKDDGTLDNQLGILRKPRIELDPLTGPVDVSKGQALSPELDAYIGQLERGAEVTRSMRSELEQQLDTWRETMELLDAGAIDEETANRIRDSLLQPIDVAVERLQEVPAEIEAMSGAWEDFAQAAGSGLQRTLADAFLGVETDFAGMLRRMAAEMAATGLLSALGSLVPGGGFLATMLGGAFGGARAAGGPVSAGKAYLVGEKGAELFIPDTAGMIKTAAQARGSMGGGGGAPTINVINNAAPLVQATARQTGPSTYEIAVNMMKAAIGSGELDHLMGAKFGVRPTLGTR